MGFLIRNIKQILILNLKPLLATVCIWYILALNRSCNQTSLDYFYGVTRKLCVYENRSGLSYCTESSKLGSSNALISTKSRSKLKLNTGLVAFQIF